jgi:MFS family permease
MQHIVISVGALLTGVLLLQIGNGLFGTLVGVRIQLAGLPAILAAGMSSAYFVGLMLGSLYGHVFISSVGHIRAFAAFAAVCATMTLAFVLAGWPGFWIVFRLAFGFSIAVVFVVIESWLNARATNETRGGVLAVYMLAVYLALGGGQLALELYPLEDDRLFVLAGLLLCASLVPVALTRTSVPVLEKPELLSPVALYRISPLGVVSSFGSGMILGPFYGLTPKLVLSLGEGALPVSMFMAAAIFGGVLLQWPLGRLSDRVDRRVLIAVVHVALAAVAAGLGFAGLLPAWLLALAGAAYGGIAFVTYPLGVAHTNDFVKPGQLLAASGGLLFAYSIGAAIGPLLAGALMDGFGDWTLYPFMAVVAAATALFAVWRATIRPAMDVGAQAPFVAVPRTTVAAVELYPHSEEEADEA